MKVLILILILTLNFQALTKADDIRDFEMEGMSVGDSLLDYFNEEIIKKSYSGAQYPNKEFIIYYFNNLPSFTIYDAVTVAVKANDKNYYIHDLGGSIYYPNNFKKCLNEMKKMEKDLGKIFTNAEMYSGENKHQYDKSRKSIQVFISYYFPSGNNSQIVCINWSNKLEKVGHVDELNLTIGTKEYSDFVQFRAFN
jgi:hypothetical protein